MLTLHQVANALNLPPLAGENPAITSWFTDSREQIAPQGALFFALVGEHHDGHRFLAELYARGYRIFVVSQGQNQSEFPEAAFLEVSNTLEALQKLAAFWREQFQYPLVGITGSNGKTIVKEWLAQLAGAQFEVVKSPKSYNSQVGVPLSLGLMEDHHTLAVMEAGISQRGEMVRLAKMLRPTFGIFTTLGTAHAEGFSSAEEKLAEKAQLFEHCETIVYNADQPEVHKYFQDHFDSKHLLPWSRTAQPGIIAASTQENNIRIPWKGKDHEFVAPFSDPVSLDNLTQVLIMLLALGMPAERIASGLPLLRPPSMRLSLKDGINDSALIDDTYNNDLAGLEVALNFMDRQPPRDGKTVILSDMAETGAPAASSLSAISERLSAHGVSRWIGVGQAHMDHSPEFGGEYLAYASTEDLLLALPELRIEKELILIKGGRSFGFEQVVATLQQKIHGTVLEVDLEALTHNLNVYRRKLTPGTKLMVMVKALAYGSGSEEVANLLQFHRVDYLGVAYADEGVQLRQRGVHLPIMVMNPSPDSFDTVLAHNLEPEMYSFKLIRGFGEYLRRRNQHCKVHLKIDTGMRRLGFEPGEIEQLLLLLQEFPEMEPVSVFSHLAGADEAEHEAFSHRQAEAFSLASTKLEAGLGRTLIKHLVNSPGILRFPQYHLDMVRLGIGLYGVEASGLEPQILKPVSRLVTTVSQIKHVPAGETVGYSRRGKADKPTTTATLAIGYADGYDRGFSRGVGEVWINGQRAPVIGNVCMDMTMVDVTGLRVKEGDQVVIFGPEIPLTELAAKIGTIPYELLTNVSTRVKRVYFTG